MHSLNFQNLAGNDRDDFTLTVVSYNLSTSFDKINIDTNLTGAIITPDKNIISDADNLSPAYLVFDNYELILKWNRSLRFALAVCTLKDKFINEL